MWAYLANALIQAPPFKGRARLLRFALRASDGGVVRSRYGVLFRVHAHDFTNWACISGAYGRDYDDVFCVVSSIDAGAAFIDIGANAGLFSMVAGGKVGPQGVVLAFEPNKIVFDQILDHAKLNDLPNVIAHQAAVGKEAGTIRFRAGGESHTGVGRIDETGDEEVRVITFDDPALLDRIGPRDVMVKIDVEGAEALAVMGLKPVLQRCRVNTVIVEIDEENLKTFGSTPAEIYQIMDEHGLKPRRGLNSGRHFNEVFVRPG